jgi:hypothetical protein
MKLIRHYEIRIKGTGEVVGKIPPQHDAIVDFAWVAAITQTSLALYEINALGDALNITPGEKE